jgi:hypothetical protein
LTLHKRCRCRPAFRASDELLHNVVSRMPNANGWQQVLLGPTSRPFDQNDVEAMQDVDDGTSYISKRTIQRFLEG